MATKLGLFIQQAIKLPIGNIARINSRGHKRYLAPTLRELYRRKQKLGEQKPNPRSGFLEWNFNAELFAFSKRLGENFNYDILQQALTHQSYLHKQIIGKENTDELVPEINLNNEELIKSGESIIETRIRDCLKTTYPDEVLRAISAYLTSESNLDYVGRHLGLSDLVLTEEYPVAPDTMAKSVKAVIGALEKSSGIEKTNKFVDDFIIAKLNELDVFDIWEPEEPYKYLTEKLLEKKKIEPRLCNQSASNTILANYQVGLYGEDKTLLGIGWGESIETAKNTAALDAIRKIYRI